MVLSLWAVLLVGTSTAWAQESISNIKFASTSPDGQYNTGDEILLECVFTDWLGVGSFIKVVLNTGDTINMVFDPKLAEDFLDPQWGIQGVRNAEIGGHARTYGVYCIKELKNLDDTKGDFVLAGGFNKYEGTTGANDFVITDHNGILKQSISFNEQVYWVEETQDGGLIAGGEFTNFGGEANYDYIVKFKYDTASKMFVVDTDFMNNITRNNQYRALDDVISEEVATYGKPQRGILEDTDGSIFIIGEFDNVGGVQRRTMAKLNADGTLNTDFNFTAQTTNGNTMSFDPDLDAVGEMWASANQWVYRVNKTTGAVTASKNLGIYLLAITVMPNEDESDSEGKPGPGGIICSGYYGVPAGGWGNMIALQDNLSTTPTSKFALGKTAANPNGVNITVASWAIDGAAFLKGKMWLGMHDADPYNAAGNYFEGGLIVLNYDGSLNTTFNDMLANRTNGSNQDGIGGYNSGGGTDIISLRVTSEDDLMVGGSYCSIMQYTDNAYGTDGYPDDQIITRLSFRRARGVYKVSEDDMLSELKIVDIVPENKGGYNITDAFGEDKETNISMDNIAPGDELESNHNFSLNMPRTNEQEAFITTWQTLADNETITIPIATGWGSYNYLVDWGITTNDGMTPVITKHTGAASYTYPKAGTYTVKVYCAIDADKDGKADGTGFPQIYFNNKVENSKDKILTVEQWGHMKWKSFTNAFHGCSKLRITATDAPNLATVTSMDVMFSECIALNDNINHWDVSNVTSMNSIFRGATSFNQPLNDWDVSQVTRMTAMFSNATSFNQPLNNWNVSQATDTEAMFEGAASFNQPLNDWNVSRVTKMDDMFRNATSFDQPLNDWDVSNVVRMYRMFRNATSFNQPLNNWNVSSVQDMRVIFYSATSFNQPLNNWDVSSVTKMDGMFYSATSFDQDLSSWQISSLTDAFGMLDNCGMSMENYDKLLIEWNKQVQAGTAASLMYFGAKGLKYCRGEEARTALIDKGWGDAVAGASSASYTDIEDAGVGCWLTFNLYDDYHNKVFSPTSYTKKYTEIESLATFPNLGVFKQDTHIAWSMYKNPGDNNGATTGSASNGTELKALLDELSIYQGTVNQYAVWEGEGVGEPVVPIDKICEILYLKEEGSTASYGKAYLNKEAKTYLLEAAETGKLFKKWTTGDATTDASIFGSEGARQYIKANSVADAVEELKLYATWYDFEGGADCEYYTITYLTAENGTVYEFDNNTGVIYYYQARKAANLPAPNADSNNMKGWSLTKGGSGEPFKIDRFTQGNLILYPTTK